MTEKEPNETEQLKRPPNDRRQMMFSKARILGVVFLAAALLTVYTFLDQRVFAPNRPIIWKTFDTTRISQDIREGRIVIVVVGQFQNPSDRSRIADEINIPVVRKEAHRLRTVFTVLPLEKSEENHVEYRQWLHSQLSEHPEIQPEKSWEEPRIIVFYRKTKPKTFDMQASLPDQLAKYLKSIRKNGLAK